MSSWQEGLCGKTGGEAESCFPFFLLGPAGHVEGTPWCFSHGQGPLSPSVPSAEDAALGSSCDGCDLGIWRG